jgi:hypothetical protein
MAEQKSWSTCDGRVVLSWSEVGAEHTISRAIMRRGEPRVLGGPRDSGEGSRALYNFKLYNSPLHPFSTIPCHLLIYK